MDKFQKSQTSDHLNASMVAGCSKSKLPDDFYPMCWQDDERMDNLFAPFRLKSVNPVNYESKMKFWKNLIKEYCQFRGNPVISLSELRGAFQRRGKRPFCLDVVLVELVAESAVRTKQQYMEAPLLTWPGWAVHKLVKAPLRWSFDVVKERVIPTSNVEAENIEYVFIDVAKNIAEKLLGILAVKHECHSIISKDDLIKMLTEEQNEFELAGIEAALHYLYCHQKASIQKTMIDNQEVIVYKFAVTWNCNVEPITLLDISIYTLNKMETSLLKSVENIESDINQTDALVRQYIRDKKRQLAKNFLRKKHVLEKNLAKTSNALTTIQTLLLQIDETKQNAKIVEAFKMGTKTLKNALGDKNITIDNVEDALADVKEILDTNADIQFALSGAQFNDIIGDGTDDETLEAELMDLLDDTRTQDEINGFGNDDPSIATATPAPGATANPSGHKRNPSSPTNITNVIDELLEERLKKLRMNDTITSDAGSFKVPSSQHVRQ